MNLHPLCAMFPEIDGQEFRDLVLDIKQNGLRDEIITLDGQILDGQNRFKACEVAGIKPRFDNYIGTNPVSFVISKNLNRRHLTTSQRAMIAAELAKCPNNPVSLKDAARAVHVSRDTVHKATRVKQKSGKLAKQVKSGKMSLNAAEAELEKKERLKNPVLATKEIEHPISLKEFQTELGRLEARIPQDADHKKFGEAANKIVQRLMNFKKDKNFFAYA